MWNDNQGVFTLALFHPTIAFSKILTSSSVHRIINEGSVFSTFHLSSMSEDPKCGKQRKQGLSVCNI